MTALLLHVQNVTGVVRNVRVVNCTVIEWEPAEEEISEYRVRLYSGSDYLSAPESQQFIVNGTTTSVTPQWLPNSKRFVFAIVCTHNIGHSQMICAW